MRRKAAVEAAFRLAKSNDKGVDGAGWVWYKSLSSDMEESFEQRKTGRKKLKKVVDGGGKVWYKTRLFRHGRKSKAGKNAAEKKLKKVVDGRGRLGYSAESVATKNGNGLVFEN